MSQDDSFAQSLDSIHRSLLSSKATLRKVFFAASFVRLTYALADDGS